MTSASPNFNHSNAINDEEEKALMRVKEIALRKGIRPEEVVKTYNEWVETYDKDELKPGRYNGPLYAAQYLHKYLSCIENYFQTEILDIGAGSGRVAYELSKLADYRFIDALDPARKFFEASPYKNLYRNHICKFLGSDTIEINADTYGAIVSAGSFAEGHIPCIGIKEMIRLVKPGGIITIVMNNTYLDQVEEYANRLEPFMEELEKLGKWEKLEKAIQPNHFLDKEGAIFVYKVTEAGCSEFECETL